MLAPKPSASDGIADPILKPVAAISVGVVDGEILLDLPYPEDVRADVDMNIVMTGDGRLVEVQGTAEHSTFDRAQLDRMLDLATGGIRTLIEQQQQTIAAVAAAASAS